MHRTTIWMLLLVTCLARTALAETGIKEPSLSDRRGYNEYWEHQFLFEDGTFATSQFLIVNFPLSKHHGLQIATLEGPAVSDRNGRIIVKNGRSRSGWHYSGADPALNIFQHRLSGRSPGFLLELWNTAAEIDILFTSGDDAVTLVPKDNELGLPAVSLYAPGSRSFGRWRPGPEIGGVGTEGAWRPLGHGHGYGLHVVDDRGVDQSVRRWRRITALSGSGGMLPIIHEFTTPSGNMYTVGVLSGGFGAQPLLERLEITGDGQQLQVHSQSQGEKLSGTVTLTDPLEDLIVSDLLSGVEQLAAGSLATIKRYRHRARYDLTFEANGATQHLRGEALFETIEVGGKEKRNRRLRR